MSKMKNLFNVSVGIAATSLVGAFGLVIATPIYALFVPNQLPAEGIITPIRDCDTVSEKLFSISMLLFAVALAALVVAWAVKHKVEPEKHPYQGPSIEQN